MSYSTLNIIDEWVFNKLGKRMEINNMNLIQDFLYKKQSGYEIEQTKNFIKKLENDKTDLAIKLETEKLMRRIRRERSVRNAPRNPSGFNRPTRLSRSLREFLGTDNSDILMPRTQVTRLIHDYIQLRQLQDPNDGRLINLDDHLQRLLQVPDDVRLSYFNLQTYLSPHFLR